MQLAQAGFQCGNDLARFLSVLMRDLAQGRLAVAEAAVQANLAGKLIRLLELRLRYGQRVQDLGLRDLDLFAAEVQTALGLPLAPPGADGKVNGKA